MVRKSMIDKITTGKNGLILGSVIILIISMLFGRTLSEAGLIAYIVLIFILLASTKDIK